MEIPEIQLSIKRGLLDNRKRQLIISPEYLVFENKDLVSDPYTRMEKGSMREFRFGVKWMRGSILYFGREYQLFIRDEDNEVLKINFRIYFGIKKDKYNELFSKMINAIWDLYFKKLAEEYLDMFFSGKEFNLCDVYFTPNDVTIKVSGILKEKSQKISWERLQVKSYYTYFTIYSPDDPANINRGYNYLSDWNALILYNVVKTILMNKKN